MKTICDNVDSYKRNMQAEFKYEITKDTKIIMEILAKNIYSDVIRAPIRELGTNAWDSHVEANNLSPFVISCPTEKDPVFKIRDYGTGLSQLDMEHMYKTYGISTKTDSNNLNGWLGIGSKSPFAYTDSFISTSYYNGKKYIYINTKNKNNTPTINRVSVTDTIEPNGLEVSFVVKTKDIKQFNDTIRDVYQYFPVTPITDGQSISSYKTVGLLKGKDWYINNVNHSFAVMGYIAYPINLQQIQTTYKDKDYLTGDWKYKYYKYKDQFVNKYLIYKKLLQQGLTIEFDIGELQHNTSREALQYDPKTVNIIKNKLDKIFTEITDQIQNLINEQKYIIDVISICKYLSNEFETNFIYKYLLDKLSYKKQSLEKLIHSNTLEMIDKIIPKDTKTVTMYDFISNTNTTSEDNSYQIRKHIIPISNYSIRKKNLKKLLFSFCHGNITLNKDDKLTFQSNTWVLVKNNTRTNTIRTIEKFIQNIPEIPKESFHRYILTYRTTEKNVDKNKISELLGISPEHVSLFSDNIPSKITKQARTKHKYVSIKYQLNKYVRNNYKDIYYEMSEKMFNYGGLFFHGNILNNSIVIDGFDISKRMLKRITKILNQPEDKIIIVNNVRSIQQLERNKKWKNADSLLLKKIDTFMSTNNKEYVEYLKYRKYTNSDDIHIFSLDLYDQIINNKNPHLNKNSLAKTIFTLIYNQKHLPVINKDRFNFFCQLEDHIRYRQGYQESSLYKLLNHDTLEVDKNIRQFIEQYPMLVSLRISTQNLNNKFLIKDIIEYINLKDTQTQN